jgi:hypothetical protein
MEGSQDLACSSENDDQDLIKRTNKRQEIKDKAKAEMKLKKQKERELKKKKYAKMFDDEAELGSDCEEHDNIKKVIDKDNDLEENEDGMDSDLDGFVDRRVDQEIREENVQDY